MKEIIELKNGILKERDKRITTTVPVAAYGAVIGAIAGAKKGKAAIGAAIGGGLGGFIGEIIFSMKSK